MKIIKAWPPNIEEIRAHGMNPTINTVFTYGDAIYTPGDCFIPRHLMEHEAAHAHQQLEYTRRENGKIESGPDAWWRTYMENPEFRKSQEIEAYRRQFGYFCSQQKNPRKRVIFLTELAMDFSGPLYGNIIGFDGAYEAIRKDIML